MQLHEKYYSSMAALWCSMFILKRKTNKEITVAFSFRFVYKGALYKDVCPVICFDVTVHKNAYKTHIYASNILGFSTTEHDDSFVVRYSYVFNVRCCLCVIATLYTSGMVQSFHIISNYSFSHSSFFSVDGVWTSEVFLFRSFSFSP